jgi:hypothetical protein
MSAEAPLPGAPFRSPTYLAKLVTVVFAPQLAGVAFRGWTVWQALGLAQADLTANPRVHQEQLAALEAAYSGTFGAFVLFFFLGLVPFCLWTYRVASNARAFGAPGPEPAFAVGWFFVPIAHLFMPIVSFARIWKASAPDERRGTPTLVIAWWLTYLLSLAFGAMAAGRVDFTISPSGSVAFLRMATFIHAIDALAVALLLAMVWSLTRRQERRAARPVPRAADLVAHPAT